MILAAQHNDVIRALYVLKANIWSIIVLRLSLAFMRYTVVSDTDLQDILLHDGKDLLAAKIASSNPIPDPGTRPPSVIALRSALQSEFVKN